MGRICIVNLIALMLVMGTSAARAGSVADEVLSQQKAALAVIKEFADSFCKTIPQFGKDESVEASGEAQVQLGTLLKKLTDLGVKGAAKYKSEEWQGPLRESLAAMVADNQHCRLEIWKDFQAKILRASAEVPAPITEEKQTIEATYRVCRALSRRECPPNTVFIGCNQSISEWAIRECGSYLATTESRQFGGICGYEVAEIRCKTSR